MWTWFLRDEIKYKENEPLLFLACYKANLVWYDMLLGPNKALALTSSFFFASIHSAVHFIPLLPLGSFLPVRLLAPTSSFQYLASTISSLYPSLLGSFYLWSSRSSLCFALLFLLLWILFSGSPKDYSPWSAVVVPEACQAISRGPFYGTESSFPPSFKHSPPKIHFSYEHKKHGGVVTVAAVTITIDPHSVYNHKQKGRYKINTAPYLSHHPLSSSPWWISCHHPPQKQKYSKAAFV